ncbi:MAG: DUF1616 domain-containing protein [Anaerolineaceae bacterium]|nr:DUF1616 domain-containing protein [Anaerolineaceae bacterium]
MLIRKQSDLILSLFVAILLSALILLKLDILILRPALAIMLVLLTGHTVLTVWANGLVLHQAVRMLLAIMLGLTITALVGLVLNYTPWGLTPQSWVLALSFVVIVHVIIAFIQRWRLVEAPQPMQRFAFNFGQGVMLILAALVVGISIMVAQIGSLNQPRPGFTQLWMTGDPSQTSSATFLGIRNEEAEPVTYNLVVTQGNEVLQDYQDIQLMAGETWQRSVDLSSLTDKTMPIEAVLYRSNKPDAPYRSVKLWLK